MGEGVGLKRQNTVIWKGSKIVKKQRHMIFERFLMVSLTQQFTQDNGTSKLKLLFLVKS